MTEKEVLYQMLNREIGNILGGINPMFKMFSPYVMNYIISTFDEYIDKFISPDTSKINGKAAASFLKEETGRRIDDFLKKFESENGKEDM